MVDLSAEISLPDGLRREPKTRQQMSRYLWKKWKLLGFFEVNSEHEFYEFTQMLKEGLKVAIQEAIDHPSSIESIPNEVIFSDVLKQAHKGFEMRTYAGFAFSQFRQSLGLVDTEYQQSLTCASSYLQFISNSKSRADFFLTHDKHYFLKTQRKRDIRFLLSNLSKYIEHLDRYPHSLLVKFLGVHSIIVPQKKKKYFIIMQNVFYPHERILERYDIKGCEIGRWMDPKDSQVILVLKDLNFEGKTICLEQQRAWFVHQVELDTEFLKTLGVMDYSLLIGFQYLHLNERNFNLAFANLIARATTLFSPTSSLCNMKSDYAEADDLDPLWQTSSVDQLCRLSIARRNTMQDFLAFYMMQKSSLEMPSGSDNFKHDFLTPYMIQRSIHDGQAEDLRSAFSFSSIAEAFVHPSHNRRLLPSTRNPLHVIDGPEYRYFVGIIDLFTVYSFRKKLEYLWKSIWYRGQSFSTVSPSCYARRLCKWVEDHTK